MPAQALADACTGVGGCLHGRWRMPAQALADACTGVGECLHGRWHMNIGSLEGAEARLVLAR